MPKSTVRAKAKAKKIAAAARNEKQSEQSACRDACCPPRPQGPRPR